MEVTACSITTWCSPNDGFPTDGYKKRDNLNQQIGPKKYASLKNHMCISKQSHTHITTKNLCARKNHLFQLNCSHPGHQQLPPTSAPVSCNGSAKTELKSGHSSAQNPPTSSHLTQSKGIISFKGLQVCPGSSSPPAHLPPPTQPCFLLLSTLRVQVTLQTISLHGFGV